VYDDFRRHGTEISKSKQALSKKETGERFRAEQLSFEQRMLEQLNCQRWHP